MEIRILDGIIHVGEAHKGHELFHILDALLEGGIRRQRMRPFNVFHDDGLGIGGRLVIHGGNANKVEGRKVLLGLTEITDFGSEITLGGNVVDVIDKGFEETDKDIARGEPCGVAVEGFERLAVGLESGVNAAALEFDDEFFGVLGCLGDTRRP